MKKVYIIWYTPNGRPTAEGCVASSTSFGNRDLANNYMKLHYPDRVGYSVQEFTLTVPDSAERKNYESFDEVLRDPSPKDFRRDIIVNDVIVNLSERLEEYSTGGEQAQRKVIAAIGRAVLALLTDKIG
jgi:hypothetical protein